MNTTTPTWESPSAGKWRDNPERLAWLVIGLSFAVFCLLLITLPRAVQYVKRYAPIWETACLQPTLGTFLLYIEDTGEPNAITSTPGSETASPGNTVAACDQVRERDRIVALNDTQGALELVSTEDPALHEVLGSIQLYSNTNLHVLRIRRPFFKSSSEPYQVRVLLEAGQAEFFTNSGANRPVRVEVETPHGVVQLNEGIYAIWVDAEHTEVSSSAGSAILWHGEDKQVTVSTGLRAWITAEGLPSEAVVAEQNLLQNGNFTEQPVSDQWPSYAVANNIASGQVRFDRRAGRNVAYFIRQSEDNYHNEVGIRQEINKAVNIYESLVLELNVNILFQSLSGGGSVNTEFPVRVEINYTDIYGKDLSWGYGFFYRTPEASNPPVPANIGIQIPQATWYHYQSANLIALLDQQGTKPARINSIRIYASGWNYQSMVSEVALNVR
jgi:hypothetical protein